MGERGNGQVKGWCACVGWSRALHDMAWMQLCVCVCVRACACVRACMRARVHMHVCCMHLVGRRRNHTHAHTIIVAVI